MNCLKVAMRTTNALVAGVFSVVVGQFPADVLAADQNGDIHSPNMSLIGRFPFPETLVGTDLAFWGDLAVVAVSPTSGTGALREAGFLLLDISEPQYPREISRFRCSGLRPDVSVWKDLVFVSLEILGGNGLSGPDCDDDSVATELDFVSGRSFKGIRIVSIADRLHPRQVAFVNTPGGSHTHTLVPDEANNRVFIYVSNHTAQTLDALNNMVIIEVPLDDPTAARIVNIVNVLPAPGCHDVTVLMPAKLAAAACATETQLWDISDPADPKVLPTGHIVNPAINFHHSTTFSRDGRTLVIGDENLAMYEGAGCPGGEAPLGALWFYDITGVGPSSAVLPVFRGTYTAPRQDRLKRCTAHNFNTVPALGKKDVLVTGWYEGGTIAVDFTDPSNPAEIAFYIASGPPASNAWSSYWYRGLVYANNFQYIAIAPDLLPSNGNSRGIDVFKIDDPDLKSPNTIKLKRLNPQTME